MPKYNAKHNNINIKHAKAEPSYTSALGQMSGDGCNIVLEGRISVQAMLSSGSRQCAEIMINSQKSARSFGAIMALAAGKHIPVRPCSPSEIDARAFGKTHGGIIALCGEHKLMQLSEMAGKATALALLEGIEDPYNFGHAVRALYASGIQGLILSPRNWTSAGLAAHASAGATERMPLALLNDADELVHVMKENNIKIVCADDSAGARDIYSLNLTGKILLCIGGEKRGVTSHIKRNADIIARIPYGSVFPASLPAHSAAAVIAFEMLRQRKKPPDVH